MKLALAFLAGLLTASYAKWALRFLLELHETEEPGWRPDSEMAAVT